jgi:sarcosine oxidase
MRTTMATWQALAARTGRSLMVRHGGLHIGGPAEMAVVAAGIAGAGQPLEEVRAGGARLADFGITLRDDEPAVYEPAAGVMWTSEVRGALADEARHAGAELREHTEVTGVEPAGDGFAVAAGGRIDTYHRLIVAGGPWAFRLAPRAAAAFSISRRFQLVWATDAALGDGCPRPWMDHAGIGYYGMVNVARDAGRYVHLAGLHQHDKEQQVTDPGEADDPATRAESVAHAVGVVTARFGLRDRPRVVDVRACHYTSTASHDFVVDECPGLPGAVLLSACSGHGFKFTVTMGEYAAALAAGEDVPHRDRFRLPRTGRVDQDLRARVGGTLG